MSVPPWAIRAKKDRHYIIVRRLWAHTEDAFRHDPLYDTWAHCLGAKGPWIAVDRREVPDEIIAHARQVD